MYYKLSACVLIISLCLQGCTITNNIPLKPEIISANIDDNQMPIKEVSEDNLHSIPACSKTAISKDTDTVVHSSMQVSEYLDVAQQFTKTIRKKEAFTKKEDLLKKEQWGERKKVQRARQERIKKKEKGELEVQELARTEDEKIYELEQMSDNSVKYILRIHNPEVIEKILLLEKIKDCIDNIFSNPIDSFVAYKQFKRDHFPLLFEGLIGQFLIKQIMNDDELATSKGKVRLCIIQTLNILSAHIQEILELRFFERLYLKDKMELINLFYYLNTRIAIAHLIYIGTKASSGVVKKSFIKEHAKCYQIAKNTLDNEHGLPMEMFDDYSGELIKIYNLMMDRFSVLANYFVFSS